jgi:hypothetical protein
MVTPPSDYDRALARVEKIRAFYSHAAIYAVVNVGLAVFNLVTSPGYLWFFWPLLGWGIGLLAHGLGVFGTDRWLGDEWRERKVREILEEEKRRRG